MLGVLLVVSPGCLNRLVAEKPRYPVIPKDPRPELIEVTDSDLSCLAEEVEANILENFQRLMSYARKLEAGVVLYNEYAREKNKEAGYDE
jgi:hypothetical protein